MGKETDQYMQVCNIRVLEAIVAFVAAEELVGEAYIATHGADDLEIHHL